MKQHKEHWEELPEINPELDEDLQEQISKGYPHPDELAKGFDKMRKKEEAQKKYDTESGNIPGTGKKALPEGFDEMSEDQRSAIAQKVRERKFVFQFIDHESGKRSEPFIGNYDLLREILQEAADRGERPDQEDYVLLVAVIGETDEDTLIPGTPLVKCKTLLDLDDIEKGV